MAYAVREGIERNVKYAVLAAIALRVPASEVFNLKALRSLLQAH